MGLFKFHLENWVTVCPGNYCVSNSVSGQALPSHRPLKSLLFCHPLLKAPSKPSQQTRIFCHQKQKLFKKKKYITSFELSFMTLRILINSWQISETTQFENLKKICRVSNGFHFFFFAICTVQLFYRKTR